MKFRNFRKNEQPLVMIIPMIDIMLFLLVFFMLSTIYMVQTNNFDVDLPQAESSKKETKPNVISVAVTADGNIFFKEEKISKQILPQKIHQVISKNEESVFVLMGDKSTKYEQVVDILEILKKSGVKKISIATKTK